MIKRDVGAPQLVIQLLAILITGYENWPASYEIIAARADSGSADSKLQCNFSDCSQFRPCVWIEVAATG
jgi:hypothetical protein